MTNSDCIQYMMRMLEMRMSCRVKPEILKCRLYSESRVKIAYLKKNVNIVLYFYLLLQHRKTYKQSCSC